jgi:hypothetical protein
MLLAMGVALLALPAWAQSDKLIADPRNGCQVHDPLPQPGESITWDGACVNKLASGKGVLRWLQDGVEQERDEGSWRQGRLNGQGVIVFASGAYFEGNFVDDRPNGYGLYVDDDGRHYNGLWKNGCFSQGAHQAVLGTTWKACGFADPAGK